MTGTSRLLVAALCAATALVGCNGESPAPGVDSQPPAQSAGKDQNGVKASGGQMDSEQKSAIDFEQNTR